MSEYGRVRVGTSGWIYKHWRGPFYPPPLPPRGWFRFYSESFDTVEINNTFYRLPPEEVFRAWGRQAPPGFIYALKASRYLTHLKKLKDPAEGLEKLLPRARLLGPHLGPILYQLPPNWRCDPARLRDFIALLPHDLEHVFEFRDPSWYTEPVRRLLEETGVNFCIHDMRGSAAPPWVTGPVVYLRFHGPTQTAYAGRYAADDLRRWAERILDFQGAGRDVYAYFNNDAAGNAVVNARELRSFLGMGFVAGQT